MGEEAATPGNQSRLRAFSGFPPAIHPRESPAAAGLPQSFRKLRNSHVSLNSLSNRLIATRNTKTLCCCEEAVEDVSSLWKSEEN
jgi:hypothetical protein